MTRMIAQPVRKIYCLVACVVLIGAMGGCATPAPVDQKSASAPSKNPRESISRPSVPRSTSGEQAAAVALNQVGVPYRYGGNSRNGFDCSGLVQYSYSQVGIQVPRTTGQLWHSTTPVPRRELRVGDLLFFTFEGKMSHVGMYIGDKRFVHAPSSGKHVSVASLESPYYSRALIRAGRPN